MKARILSLVPLFVLLLAMCITVYLFPRASLVHVSAVETAGQIRVYWDARCSIVVQSIDWGNMTLGGAKDFAVYVRNEGNQTCFLNVKTASWQPSTAVNCLNFSWSCGINKFEIGKVAKGTLSLRIPLTTTGISTFSFDIIFEGTDRLIGDVNGDGFVGIDDIFHIGTQVGKPDYDPTCDINNDGSVTMEDIFLAAQHYGEEAR